MASLAKTFCVVGAFLLSSTVLAASGLVIHTAEFGVGKFHRHDNKVHAYGASNAWTPYILPEGASSDKPLVINNADGSVTVFFSTLDDLISSVTQISQSRHQLVQVLNVHGHGLPGTMWFPSNDQELQGWTCADWKDAASGSDESNYEQYYSAVSPDEIRQIRAISDNPNIKQGCTTGLQEWRGGVAKAPAFKSVFAPNAQIHFLSCVVGLGDSGKAFTQGIAELLLPQGGRVETSMDFGLGDWSMPEGMGFWDLVSDAQVEHDNDLYAKDKKDREIAQKGTIRMATYAGASGWQSSLLSDRDFMGLGFEAGILGTPVSEAPHERRAHEPVPTRIRVPGTRSYVITQ
jgi:hypothetical protein